MVASNLPLSCYLARTIENYLRIVNYSFRINRLHGKITRPIPLVGPVEGPSRAQMCIRKYTGQAD